VIEKPIVEIEEKKETKQKKKKNHDNKPE